MRAISESACIASPYLRMQGCQSTHSAQRKWNFYPEFKNSVLDFTLCQTFITTVFCRIGMCARFHRSEIISCSQDNGSNSIEESLIGCECSMGIYMGNVHRVFKFLCIGFGSDWTVGRKQISNGAAHFCTHQAFRYVI